MPDLITPTKLLAVVGFIPLIIFFYWSDLIFILIFGEEWSESGRFASYLAINSYFMLISRPVIASIPIFNLQKIFLKFEVFSSALKLLALTLSSLLLQNAGYSVTIYSVVSSLMYICIILYVLIYSKQNT